MHKQILKAIIAAFVRIKTRDTLTKVQAQVDKTVARAIKLSVAEQAAAERLDEAVSKLRFKATKKANASDEAVVRSMQAEALANKLTALGH